MSDLAQSTLEEAFDRAATGANDPITVTTVVYCRRGDKYRIINDGDGREIFDLSGPADNGSDNTQPGRRRRSKRTWKRGVVIAITDKGKYDVKFEDGTMEKNVSSRSLKKEYAMMKELTKMKEQEKYLNLQSLEMKEQRLHNFQAAVYEANENQKKINKKKRKQKQKRQGSRSTQRSQAPYRR